MIHVHHNEDPSIRFNFENTLHNLGLHPEFPLSQWIPSMSQTHKRRLIFSRFEETLGRLDLLKNKAIKFSVSPVFTHDDNSRRVYFHFF